MVIGGNHEIEPQASGVTFKSYLTRFAVPSDESGSKTNMYYSFDAGGIHIVMLGAYVDYDKSSEFWLFPRLFISSIHIVIFETFMVGAQYAWLVKDLKNVDRKITPWLVAAWHPPCYNSYSSHYQEFECMRQELETLLFQYGVDIVFSGHVS